MKTKAAYPGPQIQIKSIFGKVLFEYESENGTLRGANLRNANLMEANLWNADLRNADLGNADLKGVKNKDTAYLPIYAKRSLTIHGDKIRIGCKEKTIAEWDVWFAGIEEFETKRGTEEFKRIQAHYEAYKAYYHFMKGEPC